MNDTMNDALKEQESSLQQPVGGKGLFEYGSSHKKDYPHDHVHQEHEKFHEGKANAHNRLDKGQHSRGNLSQTRGEYTLIVSRKEDHRSIKNRLAAEERRHEVSRDSEEVQELKKSPTLPAIMHGNKPSKGATIDAQIQQEEAEELKKKGQYQGGGARDGHHHGHGHEHGHEHAHHH